MLNYFLRRLLLVPVTFVVITFMVYAILRSAPGGPIEQLERQLRAEGMGEAGGPALGLGDQTGLDEDAKEELRRYYNLDRPIPIGYLEWLGVKPRIKERAVRIEERQDDTAYWNEIDTLWRQHRDRRAAFEALLAERRWMLRSGQLMLPVTPARRQADEAFFAEADALEAEGPERRRDLDEHLASRGFELGGSILYGPLTDLDREEAGEYHEAVLRAREASDASLQRLEEALARRSLVVNKTGRYYHRSHEFSGILQGDLGMSFTYNQPALAVIVSKFPISIYFGLIGYIAAWVVCIPLGVFKAIYHRSTFDTTSSVTVFFGYSLPGFVACLLLLVYFGGGTYFNWFPLGGFRSPEWDVWWANGEYLRCILDQIHHTAIPVFGYLIGSFATMTVLMKNSLMENLGADYVRTAFAKGLPERRVIFVHALRNSLIPITAGIGNALGLLFAGSFLIEKTCNIPGMGLLGFNSILARDYPIMLGTLVFLVLIRLVGNIISDLIWALIDPRIRFQ